MGTLGATGGGTIRKICSKKIVRVTMTAWEEEAAAGGKSQMPKTKTIYGLSTQMEQFVGWMIHTELTI